MARYRVEHGDCRELFRKAKGRFHFIFADPPFNIGHPYTNFKDKMSPEAYRAFTEEWVMAVWEALTPYGILALHGPNALAEFYLYLAQQNGFARNRIAWINWHYRFAQDNRHNWPDTRCHCLVFARNPDQYTWEPGSVLVPSDRAAVYGDERTETSATPGLRLPGTVWGVPSDGPYWGRVQGQNKERQGQRPNQLPEVYLERLILAYTQPGNLVGDPFSGTGTTATVAVALGRDAYVTDIDEEAVECTKKRILAGAVRVGLTNKTTPTP